MHADLPGGTVGGAVVGSGVVDSVKLTNREALAVHYVKNKEASTVLCTFCCKARRKQ